MDKFEIKQGTDRHGYCLTYTPKGLVDQYFYFTHLKDLYHFLDNHYNNKETENGS